MSYRFADNGVGSDTNKFGNYILKRGAGEVRKPTWNRTETVVRFLPQFNFKENRWEPFRNSPDQMDFGDWIRRYDAVRGFGSSNITMLLYDPVTNPNYDIQSNPCVVLYNAINRSIDNKTCDPEWPALLRKGKQDARAPLSRNQPIYITRAAIFRINSKDMATTEKAPLGLSADDAAFFLELPRTVGEKLVRMLEERTPDYSGDPYDYAAAFKYGDIVSLDQGAYVHIFEEGADPRVEEAHANPVLAGAPRSIVAGSTGRGQYAPTKPQGGFKSYDMYIDHVWKGFAAQLNTPELEALVKSKQKPWEDCLQFLNDQEQAFLVQGGFPASAILYAWRDRPEWIKDETRSRAVGRVSAVVSPPAAATSLPPRAAMPPANVSPPPAAPRLPASIPTAGPGWGTKPADDGVRDMSVPAVVNSVDAVANAVNTAFSVPDVAAERDRVAKAMEAAKAAAQKVRT